MNEIAAALVWIAGLLAWWVIRYPYQRRARGLKVIRHHKDLEERLLLLFSIVTLAIMPVTHWATSLFRFANYPFQPSMGLLGAVVLAAFLWLFRQSHSDLGGNWSVTLEIRERHSLVTAGVYRYIRHPMYASFWLWALAQALLIPNFIVGPASLVSVGFLYMRRSGREEQMMMDEFGEEYRAYAEKTARLIPGIF
ncbi:MAG: methyltransferase [Gammaproteobacteria bacterium RIFOXYA12_FULL_61_12]|nr:MAG: methyltransferase [Gammaproteobacteria bacterium RIFOXYD12_FULL_61_37]OGT93738.1 MAG: methyltransferase [Gammaproteobacteria bacterium RIFOXYA12_FULL_61_12]